MLRMLRTRTVACVAFAFVSSAYPVLAADVPMAAPTKAPVVAPAAPWTGPYVGVHVGHGSYDAEDKSLLPAVFAPFYDGKFDGDGWLAGVQAGYDHQWGNLVLGIVADYSWSGMDGSKSIAGGFVTIPHEIESFGTARLRGGFAWDNLLLYGTVGAAYAQTKTSINIGPGIFSTSAETDRVGWAYGLGGEWRFAPNWSLGAEWLRLDFGTDNVAFSTPFLGIVAGVPVDLDADIIRANLNYRW